jgi:spore coat polysaccharide biosynthesis protein SpsF (cytidylyltransferase family)
MGKVVAIIQSRLGSKRLPNKVLLKIPKKSGITCLGRVIERLKNCTLLDSVILTTPDRELGNIARHYGIDYQVYHGKRDVAKEYLEAARSFGAEIIVRITADCPLIDPEIVDRCIDEFLDSEVDLVYNTDRNKDMVGDGLDVEVFSLEALERTNNEAKGDIREHFTYWMRENLKTKFVKPPDFQGCSLDTWDDYERICELYEKEESKVNFERSSRWNGNRLDKCRSS